MNKLTPIIFLLCFGLIANAQVPNGSFENWTNYTIPSIKDWSILGNVSRTEDAASGNYAVRLENNAANNTFGAVLKANIGSASLSGGEPYTDIPNVITFKAKFDIAIGDIGRMVVTMRKNGQDIGGFVGSFEGNTADTFMHFREAIFYSDIVVPDTIIVVIISKDFDNQTINGDGYLIIDDIKLENFGDPSADIKNADFEDWDEQHIPHPEGWFTTDIFIYENVGIIPPLPLVSESNDAFEGSKAMLVRNRQFGQDILPGIVISGNELSFEKPAFSVNSRWEYFTGKYKYNSTLDTATVLVTLFKNGFPVASAIHHITPAQDNNYKTFGFRLNYTVQTTPDSGHIVITCADGDNPRGANTTLLIDQLEFTNELINIDNLTTNNFKMYPNPTNGIIHFSETIEKIEIWNIQGQLLEQFENTNTININHLPNQIYLIKTTNNNQLWTQRIIKQ